MDQDRPLERASAEGSPALRPAAPRSAASAGASRIRFDGVSVIYGETTVLDRLDLTVNPGEIVALIGPSGSGKTTALRAVAGFVRPSAGRIHIGERDVTEVAPHARKIGMVVQNYALFPHMNVAENVAFGLRAQHAAARDIAARVPACLEMVGMGAYAQRYPRQLSGGQQQRVAIARAIAVRPQVLLLDEPLSALDTQIRRAMVDEIARLHRDLPELTVLYVTHDQTEALTLADHIGIMRDGRLQAFGRTRPLFISPPNRFAAEFLGRANLLEIADLQPIAYQRARASLGPASVEARNPHNLPAGARALLCIRPHHLRLAPAPNHTNRLAARIAAIQWQGEVLNLTLSAAGATLTMTCPPTDHPPQIGEDIDIFCDPAEVSLVPEDADRR